MKKRNGYSNLSFAEPSAKSEVSAALASACRSCSRLHARMAAKSRSSMPGRVRALFCVGPALCLSMLMLSACSTMPTFRLPSDDMQTPLELFAIASSSPGKREALWRNVRHQQESSENTLKRALLQSMPGHSGYDPRSAEHKSELQSLMRTSYAVFCLK